MTLSAEKVPIQYLCPDLHDIYKPTIINSRVSV